MTESRHPEPLCGAELVEPIIEADLPIVDAHHHLWFMSETDLRAMEDQANIIARGLAPICRRRPRYLIDELLADLKCGHDVRGSVYVEGHAMYRRSGAESMRSIGEVEFANGIAAMTASGAFGDVRACAGIVGNVDLRLGPRAESVIRAHIQSAGVRYCGVRCAQLTAYDADSAIIGTGVPKILLDHDFRIGFSCLHKLDLSFDAIVLEPQLPDLIDIARAFPETRIILNHVGCPVNVARYAGRQKERFVIWQDNVRALAACDNVFVKLGGLGMPIGAFKSFGANPTATSAEIAAEWRPYIETCIEAFGAYRCMFESNFPVDSGTCTYRVLWNVFKRLSAGASKEEKTALFGGTAKRAYRLHI